MADVIAYTRGQYVTDLLAGGWDPQATPRIVKKVTELTGLDPAFVKYSGGRIETRASIFARYTAKKARSGQCTTRM